MSDPYTEWLNRQLRDLYNYLQQLWTIGQKRTGIIDRHSSSRERTPNNEKEILRLRGILEELETIENLIPEEVPGLQPAGNYTITGGFMRDYTNISNAVYSHHEGIDWATPVGTNIVTHYAGVVELIRNDPPSPSLGKYIVIRDRNNRQLFYLGAHMNNFEVSEGDNVEIGDIIGTSGATGIGGAHFHTSTSLVPSEQLYGGFFRSSGPVNTDYIVDPNNHNVRWTGRIIVR